MIEDFTNLTIEKCKELVLEYQKTRDPKIFSLLIAKFDIFIMYCIRKYRKCVWFVRGESLQELYHVSILGIHKGILTFHKEDSPSSLLWRIKNYLMEELRQEYSYKIKESPEEIGGDILQNKVMEEYKKYREKLFVSTLMNSSILTDYEKELIKLRYLEELTVEEVSKKIGHAYSTTWIHLDQILKKIKEKLNVENRQELF